MTRSFRWFGLVALAVFGVAAGPARAQVVPWKVTGSGSFSEGVSPFGANSPHDAAGTATHIGKFSGDGVFNSLSFDPTTGGGTFHGVYTFVARNGDKLACTYGDTDNGADQVGAYQLYPTADGKVYVVFVAEFNPIPSECTGRFKNVVDGSLLVTAVSEPFELAIDANGFTPPFDFAAEGSGWLKYKRGR